MGYADILVALDLGEDAPDRVSLAAGLAKRFQATLTGAAAGSSRSATVRIGRNMTRSRFGGRVRPLSPHAISAT